METGWTFCTLDVSLDTDSSFASLTVSSGLGLLLMDRSFTSWRKDGVASSFTPVVTSGGSGLLFTDRSFTICRCDDVETEGGSSWTPLEKTVS